MRHHASGGGEGEARALEGCAPAAARVWARHPCRPSAGIQLRHCGLTTSPMWSGFLPLLLLAAAAPADGKPARGLAPPFPGGVFNDFNDCDLEKCKILRQGMAGWEDSRGGEYEHKCEVGVDGKTRCKVRNIKVKQWTVINAGGVHDYHLGGVSGAVPWHVSVDVFYHRAKWPFAVSPANGVELQTWGLSDPQKQSFVQRHKFSDLAAHSSPGAIADVGVFNITTTTNATGSLPCPRSRSPSHPPSPSVPWSPTFATWHGVQAAAPTATRRAPAGSSSRLGPQAWVGSSSARRSVPDSLGAPSLSTALGSSAAAHPLEAPSNWLKSSGPVGRRASAIRTFPNRQVQPCNPSPTSCPPAPPHPRMRCPFTSH